MRLAVSLSKSEETKYTLKWYKLQIINRDAISQINVFILVLFVSGYMQMSQDKKIWNKRWFAVHKDYVLYSFKAHQVSYGVVMEQICVLCCLPLGIIVDYISNENILG